MTPIRYEYAKHELDAIHKATLKILSEAGVCFESEGAIEIFRKHDFRTEGQKVFIHSEMKIER